ncbi:MAG: hypothetical protein ACKOPM_06765 [Novosphingobium sp.]
MVPESRRSNSLTHHAAKIIALACHATIHCLMGFKPSNWQDAFIDRPVELASLDEEWRLAKQREPRIVALIAEQGFGKTRLAQRFFHRLSTTEDISGQNGWWPDRLEGEHSTDEVTPVLSEHPAGVEMPFLWWGIKLRDPGNSPVRFSTELTAARETLRSYLHRHIEAQAYLHRKERVNAAVRKLALDLVVDAAPEMLTGGLAGPIKTIAEGGKEIFEAYHNSLPGQQDHVEAILADLRSVCATPPQGIKPVPICLLIDDFQWLSADLEACRLLDRLCEVARNERWPLLILATSWERGWYGEANRARFTGWGLPTRQLDIGPISLAALVCSALPGLTKAQVDLLLDRAEGNPRSLKYLLANLLEDRRHCFVDRDTTSALTTEGEAYVRDQTHDSVVAERFLKSPQPVKTLLAAASLQGVNFAPKVAARTCRALAVEVDDVHFESAERPYAFIFRRAPTAAEFRQNNVWRAAAEWLPNLADPDRAKEAFSQAMSDLAKEGDHGIDHDAADELLANERLGDSDVWKRNEGRMALMRLFQRAMERREFAVAASVADRWFDTLDVNCLDDLRYAFDMRMHTLIAICQFLVQGPRRHEVARRLIRLRLELRLAFEGIEGSLFALGVLDEPDSFRTTLAYRNATAVLVFAAGEAIAPAYRQVMARQALEVTQLGVDDGAMNWDGLEGLMAENEFSRNFNRRKFHEFHDILITANRLTDDPDLKARTTSQLDTMSDELQALLQGSPLDGFARTQAQFREMARLAASGDHKSALHLLEKGAAQLANRALHQPTFLSHVLVADWHAQGLRAIFGKRHLFGFPRKLSLRGLEAGLRAFRLAPWEDNLTAALLYLTTTAKKTVRNSQIAKEIAPLMREKLNCFDEHLVAHTGTSEPPFVPRDVIRRHGELCVISARLQIAFGNKGNAIEDAKTGLSLAKRHLDPFRSLRDASVMWAYYGVLQNIFIRTWELRQARQNFRESKWLLERAQQISEQNECGFDLFAFMRGEAPDLEALDLAADQTQIENPTLH